MKNIAMKIQFRTNTSLKDACYTFLFSCVVYAISFFNTHLQSLFGNAEESILSSRGLNVKHISPLLYCELPYDDCLCTVLLNKSDNSEKCFTDIQLMGSRILPIVSFFLQIYLVRKLISLNSNHCRVIIYTLSIVSIFTCIGMTICIFWSSCYHVSITFTLLLTSSILWILSFYNMLVSEERFRSCSHCNKIAADHSSKRNNNPNRAWQEVP
jgi:hypothetical protein